MELPFPLVVEEDLRVEGDAPGEEVTLISYLAILVSRDANI